MALARPSRRTLATLPRFLIALILAIVWALPMAWMLVTSVKPESQIVTMPIHWMPERLSDFTFQNYINVLAIPRGVDLIRSFLNSVTVALVGTLSVVVVDTLAAYALARLHFPGRDVLFYAIVASLIVPPEILLIPNYITVWRLDWLNTLLPLIIPPAGSGFGVFLLRQFFLSISYGARGRWPHRRLRATAHPVVDCRAAFGWRHRHAGDLHVSVLLERLHLAIDHHQRR